MRRLTAPAGLLLATLLVVAPALTALAAPVSRGAHVADPPAITWSVEPTDAAGVSGRASFAYAVDPGTQINDYLGVSNFGDATTTFKLYATDAINDFETGAFGLFPAVEDPTDVGSWITLAQDSVTVAPGQRVIVPITTLVPSDATPGDHTAGVIASFTTETTGDDGAAVALEQRVAARVYLRVSGDPIASVEATGLVGGFTPEWNPFGGGTGGIDYAVTNTGNVRVDVGQKVVLTGPFGIPLGSIEPDDVVNLLPGQSAHVHAELHGVAPLLLLFGAVTLTPGAPTDTVAQSEEQTADGSPAEPRPAPDYRPVTATTMTGAVSWTLLLVVIVLVVLFWLAVRYVRVTRERMYEAIDEATERAQREALEAGARDADRASVP